MYIHMYCMFRSDVCKPAVASSLDSVLNYQDSSLIRNAVFNSRSVKRKNYEKFPMKSPKKYPLIIAQKVSDEKFTKCIL